MTTLAGTAVALVILADLATGQGPPQLNAYRDAMLPQKYRQPPPVQYQALGYAPPRPEYEPEQSYPEPALSKKDDDKSKKYTKDKDDKDKYDSYGSGDKKSGKDKSTPAPGMFGSFSNSMSDAWSK